jgi:hypothetical protein
MLKLTDRGNLFEHYKVQNCRKNTSAFESRRLNKIIERKTYLWENFNVKL